MTTIGTGISVAKEGGCTVSWARFYVPFFPGLLSKLVQLLSESNRH